MRLQEPKLRTLDEEITRCLETAEKYEIASKGQDISDLTRKGCQAVATEQRQLAERLRELKEAKRLLQAAEKTINDYCRGYCECCKNRDFELARCGLVNGCRDKDNWEWILSYRVKELFKED